MLIITGNYKGQEYKEKMVSVKDAIDLFGIQILDRKKIEMISTRVKPDIHNGGEKHPNSVTVPLTVNLRNQNGSVELIYAQQRQRNPDNSFRYLPTHTDQTATPFVGKEIVINSISDMEMAIFYMVHPWCKSSPFVGPNPRWDLNLPEVKAQHEVAKLRILSDLQSQIFSWDENTLRTVAAGINMKRGKNTISIQSVDDKDANTLRIELVNMLNINPESFQKAATSAQTKLYGMIARAIDKRIFVQLGAGSNKHWAWGQDFGGESIVAIGALQPVAALRNYISTNLSEVIPTLKSALETKQINDFTETDEFAATFESLMADETEESVPVEEMTPQQMLDMIRPDLEIDGNVVSWIVDGQLVGGKALAKLDDPQSFEKEMLERLEPGKLTYNRVRNFFDKKQ